MRLFASHRLCGPAWAAAVVAGACLAPPVHAQSSVNAYGLVDVSVGQFQNAGAVRARSVESGKMSTSFVGFKGSEDLGGGLSARFAIESFMRLNSGDAGRFNGDAFWSRSAYVGLSSSSLGSLHLGRNTTSLFVSALVFNAFGDSFGFSPTIRHYFTSGTVTGDTGWSDSASYTSPRLGSVTIQLQAAEAGAAGGGRNFGGHLMFFSGPLGATLAVQDVKKGATVDDTRTLAAGLSYDFGAAKLFVQYGTVDNKTRGTDFDLTDLSVSVPAGAGKVLLAAGRLKPQTGASTTTISVGYDHNLSKRTDAYAVFMNDRRTGVASGNSLALGVRHRF